MRTLLGTVAALTFGIGSALAADLPVRTVTKAPVAMPVSSFSWSGCYIGAHGGGGWGHKRWEDVEASAVASKHDIDGWLAGGQVGCDIQSGTWVFGIEGSASWSNLKGDSYDVLSPDGRTLRNFSKVDFIGTLTGRLGWAADRALFYVKGGVALVHDKYKSECASDLGATCNSVDLIGTTYRSGKESPWGWLIGVGLEVAFAPNWSGKIEYNYMDFDSDRTRLSGPIATTSAEYDIRQHVHVAKVGLNYRFGGPVVARY